MKEEKRRRIDRYWRQVDALRQEKNLPWVYYVEISKNNLSVVETVSDAPNLDALVAWLTHHKIPEPNDEGPYDSAYTRVKFVCGEYEVRVWKIDYLHASSAKLDEDFTMNAIAATGLKGLEEVEKIYIALGNKKEAERVARRIRTSALCEENTKAQAAKVLNLQGPKHSMPRKPEGGRTVPLVDYSEEDKKRMSGSWI